MNPYLLLALGAAWLASVGAAYYKGSEHAENAAKAAYAKQLDGVIAQHNADSLIDMQAAADAATRDAKAKTRTITITNTVEKVLHDKPAAPECRLTADTFDLLRVAVQVANGTDTDAAKPVPSERSAVKPAR